MGYSALMWLILLAGLAPFGYYLLAIFSALRFFRRRAELPADFTPPVTILKPVRGLDREAYENFASFCRQDYPEYEVIFGVSDSGDPAVSVIEQVIRDFPNRAVRLVVGSKRVGPSNKVNKLCHMVREAHYDLLVINDSDIRVGPSYLRAVAAPFRDARVGAVTCLYRGLVENSLPAEIEAVGNTSDFDAGVLVAWCLEGVKFALGATMATTRQRLAEIGGFEALADYYSDDFELGHRIAAKGHRVVLSPYPVLTVFPQQSLRDTWEHQVRWALTTRHSRPLGHLGLLLTYGLPWSIAAAAVAPSTAVAAGYLVSYVVLRLAMAWTVGVWGVRDPLLRRKLWLVPVRDALAFTVWVASFFVSRINWRGSQFYVRKGRLVPIEPPAARG